MKEPTVTNHTTDPIALHAQAMNYQITETELNRLNECRRQVLLVWDLCGYVDGKQMIAVDGLLGLVEMVKATLDAIAKAAEERQPLARTLENNVCMSPLEWRYALSIAAGKWLEAPPATAERVAMALSTAALANPDWQQVALKWGELVWPRDAGADNSAPNEHNANPAKAPRSKRERLAERA